MTQTLNLYTPQPERTTDSCPWLTGPGTDKTVFQGGGGLRRVDCSIDRHRYWLVLTNGSISRDDGRFSTENLKVEVGEGCVSTKCLLLSFFFFFWSCRPLQSFLVMTRSEEGLTRRLPSFPLLSTVGWLSGQGRWTGTFPSFVWMVVRLGWEER